MDSLLLHRLHPGNQLPNPLPDPPFNFILNHPLLPIPLGNTLIKLHQAIQLLPRSRAIVRRIRRILFAFLGRDFKLVSRGAVQVADFFDDVVDALLRLGWELRGCGGVGFRGGF
jgi:hypothetical protein